MGSQRTIATVQDLVDLMERHHEELGRPMVVGISGFCGAGKSTLARRLVEGRPGFVRLRGDDFLDPDRSHRRSRDWDGVERDRLVREVLIPFRSATGGQFRRFDWSRGHLGEPEPVPDGEVMVVDLIGLFHPDSLAYLDLTIWCDVALSEAAERGIRRDAESGRDHEALWREVWLPNELDFEADFSPRAKADVLFSGRQRP